MRRAAVGARGASRTVLPLAAGPGGASRHGGQWACALVRTVAGGVGDGVVDRQSGGDSGGGAPEAEDGRARRRASAAIADGGAVRAAADLGAASGGAGSAATGAASAPVGGDADAGEEPTAGGGAERGRGAVNRGCRAGRGRSSFGLWRCRRGPIGGGRTTWSCWRS